MGDSQEKGHGLFVQPPCDPGNWSLRHYIPGFGHIEGGGISLQGKLHSQWRDGRFVTRMREGGTRAQGMACAEV